MPTLGESMSVSGALQALLLEMGQQHSLDALLRVVVNRLAEEEHIALARIWLTRPGDICAACPMRDECPDQARCLHISASAGQPRADSANDWHKIDGEFRRMPIGVHKVGRIAATGDCVSIMDIAKDAAWIANPNWANSEGIRGFAGQPLIFNGDILGVIAVFTRCPLGQPCLDWLRTIADLAAASIANTYAFEQIQSLRAQLELENEYLREEISDARAYGDIVGNSPALRTIIQQIELVAPTDASVLILGESGTGKELVAQEIHRRSERGGRAMVRVNCASVPRELYESEFFGHAKGAFTGAVRDRPGRFEIANKGTLFLDEIGEVPLELQSKLLRVLQEGTYERIGEEKTREADVRLITATNRDLRAEVEARRFREDLFYRLNVFPIEVPPLRKRKEDIPLLAEVFVEKAQRRFSRPHKGLTQANILALQAYDWPGNVRELLNVIERAVITSPTGSLRFELPNARPRKTNQSATGTTVATSSTAVMTDAEMKQRERENILAALEAVDWRIHGTGGAAELLGMRPTTLASRVKRMGLGRFQSQRQD